MHQYLFFVVKLNMEHFFKDGNDDIHQILFHMFAFVPVIAVKISLLFPVGLLKLHAKLLILLLRRSSALLVPLRLCRCTDLLGIFVCLCQYRIGILLCRRKDLLGFCLCLCLIINLRLRFDDLTRIPRHKSG